MFVATQEELELVADILTFTRSQVSRTLSTEDAIDIFNRSGLSRDDLREIWRFADHDRNGLLTSKELAMALRLMGWVQAGEPLSEVLFDLPGPLPTIEGVSDVQRTHGPTIAPLRVSPRPPQKPLPLHAPPPPPLQPDSLATPSRAIEDPKPSSTDRDNAPFPAVPPPPPIHKTTSEPTTPPTKQPVSARIEGMPPPSLMAATFLTSPRSESRSGARHRSRPSRTLDESPRLLTKPLTESPRTPPPPITGSRERPVGIVLTSSRSATQPEPLPESPEVRSSPTQSRTKSSGGREGSPRSATPPSLAESPQILMGFPVDLRIPKESPRPAIELLPVVEEPSVLPEPTQVQIVAESSQGVEEHVPLETESSQTVQEQSPIGEESLPLPEVRPPTPQNQRSSNPFESLPSSTSATESAIEIADLKTQLEAAQKKNQELEDQLQDMELAMSQILIASEHGLAAEDGALTTMTMRLTELEHFEKEYQEAAEQLRTATRDVEELKKEKEDQRREMQQAIDEKDREISAFKARTAEAETSKAAVERATSNVQRLSAENLRLTRRLEDRERVLGKEKEQLHARIQELEITVAKLQWPDAEHIVETVTRDNDVLQAQIQQLVAAQMQQQAAHEMQVSEFQRQLAEVRRDNGRLALAAATATGGVTLSGEPRPISEDLPPSYDDTLVIV